MQASINQPLPIGHQLQDYEIRKVLSAGGFSFVYIARDAEQKTVAIKEYLPTSLALRTEGAHIEISPEAIGNFRHGLKCFFEEGRALANRRRAELAGLPLYIRELVFEFRTGKSLRNTSLVRGKDIDGECTGRQEHFM